MYEGDMGVLVFKWVVMWCIVFISIWIYMFI